MDKKIKPNYNQAVLKPLEEGEKNISGIIIPDIGEDSSRMAEVVEIAPTYNFNLGTLVEPLFKKGDIVLFPPLGGVKIKVEGEDYIIMSVTDLLASIE